MNDRWTLHVGDCRDVMRAMEPESIDSIVSDPPYGLSFMGKGWDHGVPGVEFWAEAFRVAKPGAHLLAFGGTRTYHRLACAVEDAGWEVRDCLGWMYGSGFPKSHDVSKAIDRETGAQREVVGSKLGQPGYSLAQHKGRDVYAGDWTNPAAECAITAPATDSARQWQGWGTALKPAWEPIILARKPLRGTVAANVLEYGTGAINVDGCRIEAEENLTRLQSKTALFSQELRPWKDRIDTSDLKILGSTIGRWPANFIHDGSEEVAGLLGDAARFFYCPKASKRDRDEGCDGLEVRQTVGGGGTDDPNGDGVCGKYGSVKSPARNHHPTVKPTDLMRYLCRLVTPPSGLVFDPFTGSGSTGKAAMLEGFRFVGAELSEEYATIARARIGHAAGRERQMELALA
jgi:site-specific DNA-methyltransferase (adenine-specific)